MQPLSWQEQLARAIRRPEALLSYVGLRADALGFSPEALRGFPLRVPHAFADRIRKGDPEDPLLRQVFPFSAEARPAPGFVTDPLGEAAMRGAPGLLQKYHGRVLAITTGACAIHCRYCFRRHFPYQDSAMTRGNLDRSLAAIEADKSIAEVILSGGDPLSLSDRRLFDFFEALSAIRHIKRIRFHTRLPIVLPARISATLTARLAASAKTVVFVLHINHANEIDGDVIAAAMLLRKAGILLFNQSVLLRGVNDSVERLIALSETLIENGISPYYLHLLDPVAGAAHYAVGPARATRLITAMRSRVSGYLVPRLAREESGAPAKTLLLG